MPKPVVAVVGRPNVGKSTLVNRIAVSRDAIVHESRGRHARPLVPRRRLEREGLHPHRHRWHRVRQVPRTSSPRASASRRSWPARRPTSSSSWWMARPASPTRTRRSPGSCGGRRSRSCSSSTSATTRRPSRTASGTSTPSASASRAPSRPATGTARATCSTRSWRASPSRRTTRPEEDMLSLAIVGRPNVGKSSLANRLANKKRSIVSDVAGTTRDAIDTVIEWKGMPIRLVDTAGMRKKTPGPRGRRVLQPRARPPGHRPRRRVPARRGRHGGRDRAGPEGRRHGHRPRLRPRARAQQVGPSSRPSSSATRSRHPSTSASRSARGSPRSTSPRSPAAPRTRCSPSPCAPPRRTRPSSGPPELNDLLSQIREGGFTRSERGRRLKIQYATQTGSKPPVICFWCNAPDLVDDNFERFLENRLRERFDLTGTPVRLKFRKKSEGGDR